MDDVALAFEVLGDHFPNSAIVLDEENGAVAGHECGAGKLK
jgi:hypothetical protein